jgi:GrpB-like predicted nucleotidyltransferase (UPF0157 family)
VVVVEYDPAWPGSFDAFRRLLADTLGPAAVAIAHVGSTAVPGLAAQPIIDIDAAVADYSSAHELREALESAGFKRALDGDLRDRQFYTREEAGQGTCHLSLTYLDSETWLSHRALRDRLLADPEARREYGELKRRLAARRLDPKAYSAAKTEVIERLAGAGWRRPPRRQPIVSRRLLVAGGLAVLALLAATAGVAYYSETSRGPDGLPDHRPIRATDLAPRAEAKLFYPGSTVVASSRWDQSADPSNPASAPARIETLLATVAPATTVRGWYVDRLSAAGWQAAPSNPSGDPGNGELDLEWSRGSREYIDLRLNLDRTSLGSAGSGVVGQLYRVIYLVGTGRR